MYFTCYKNCHTFQNSQLVILLVDSFQRFPRNHKVETARNRCFSFSRTSAYGKLWFWFRNWKTGSKKKSVKSANFLQAVNTYKSLKSFYFLTKNIKNGFVIFHTIFITVFTLVSIIFGKCLVFFLPFKKPAFDIFG